MIGLHVLADAAVTLLDEARSHHFVTGGPDAGAGAWAEHTGSARRNAARTGRPEAVHAHRFDAPCNERCTVVTA